MFTFTLLILPARVTGNVDAMLEQSLVYRAPVPQIIVPNVCMVSKVNVERRIRVLDSSPLSKRVTLLSC